MTLQNYTKPWQWNTPARWPWEGRKAAARLEVILGLVESRPVARLGDLANIQQYLDARRGKSEGLFPAAPGHGLPRMRAALGRIEE